MAVDKWVGGDLWTAVHALIHGHAVIVHNSTAGGIIQLRFEGEKSLHFPLQKVP